jgi:hypothetical protein
MLIGKADDPEGQGLACLQQDGRTRLAQPAEDAVFLDRDDCPGFLGSPEDGSFVQRLEGMHAQNSARAAFGGQQLGRCDRHRHCLTAGDEGQVAAIPDQ